MKRVKKGSKAAKRPEKPNANKAAAQKLATDFQAWIGAAAKGAPNPNPRFTTEDQLWEKDVD